MTPPNSDSPPTFDLADGVAETLDEAPADERVYRVALQLYEPTRIAEVAERADCAPDTARRHLRRLAEIGVIERVADDPATYRRNESYFEWRKQSRLEALPPEDLRDRLEALVERERTFRERYDASAPDEIDALDHADYDDVETVWLDVDEWATVRERIDRLEEVRRQRAADASSESGAA